MMDKIQKYHMVLFVAYDYILKNGYRRGLEYFEKEYSPDPDGTIHYLDIVSNRYYLDDDNYSLNIKKNNTNFITIEILYHGNNIEEICLKGFEKYQVLSAKFALEGTDIGIVIDQNLNDKMIILARRKYINMSIKNQKDINDIMKNQTFLESLVITNQ